ncbi:Forkhead-associated (FHA) domain-containing protein [Artemisia annua]|uniref:Forkhead-associated (FHA) domain-containing protein n=1 Tax=Artemisia annua TaxID=35608 RepID=A0A2U1Q5F5_ARTAN|nr:Forkhead-associated (FHA) domain-containing protein [Artemisia annua]
MDTMIAFCVRILYIRSFLATSPELQSIKKSSIGSSPEGSHGRYDPTIKNALIVEGQAIIKLESDGSFRLKNLGVSSISLNGNEVAHGQVVALGSSYLIEAVDISTLRRVNPFECHANDVINGAKGFFNRYIQQLAFNSLWKFVNVEYGSVKTCTKFEAEIYVLKKDESGRRNQGSKRN